MLAACSAHPCLRYDQWVYKNLKFTFFKNTTDCGEETVRVATKWQGSLCASKFWNNINDFYLVRQPSIFLNSSLPPDKMNDIPKLGALLAGTDTAYLAKLCFKILQPVFCIWIRVLIFTKKESYNTGWIIDNVTSSSSKGIFSAKYLLAYSTMKNRIFIDLANEVITPCMHPSWSRSIIPIVQLFTVLVPVIGGR